MRINRRVAQLKPSSTLVLNQKAKALKASGLSIVNLTAGEPDVPTPAHVCDKAIDAIRRGETRYTATSGIPELRKAVAETANRTYGRDYKSGEVIVTSGGKQALFNVSMVLLDEGDEAVIFSPYWVSYVEMVKLAGATPVIVEAKASNGFAPTPDQIRNAVTERTRLIFVNSPCNPTGSVYADDVLEAIVEAAARNPELTVMTDDIYEHFLYDGRRFSSVAMLKGLRKEQLVIVSGVSKSYSMTGWRIGYALAPKSLVEALEIVQSASTSNAASVSQWAALEALTGPQSGLESMKSVYQERRDRVYSLLSGIPGLRCVKPAGAFYFFPDTTAFQGRSSPKGVPVRDDVELATYLLEECGVAVVPGSAFGAPGYLRLSIGAALKELEEGISRMAKGLGSLK